MVVDTQLQREDRDGAVRPGGFAPAVAVGDAISAVPGVKRALAQPCRINSAAVQNDIERALFMSTDMYIYILYTVYKSSIF